MQIIQAPQSFANEIILTETRLKLLKCLSIGALLSLNFTCLKAALIMNRLLVVLFLCISSLAFSQSSEKYNSDYANFYRAEELFQKKQYSAARKEFRNFLDTYKQPTDPMYIKALYYEGISALELFNNDAVTLLENFNRNYPESIYRKDIYFRLGKFYYQKKDYEEALVWFDKLSATDLEEEFRDEFYFKLGYANFQEEKMEPARSAFHEVKDGVSQYANPALYYYSHIAYRAGNYQTALDGFLKLEKDEQFGKVVPYYILQIYYLQGDYEKVTDYAPNLENATVVNEKDVNHLIGDAYYRTGKYDESVPYLEAYDKSSETSRDEDYQLGFAYYKSKQYENAIKLFDKVGRDKDSLGQVAFYQIGESFMQLKNFPSARAAFMQASEIEANPVIEEDALYQSAVLSYKLDINPYNEAIVAFERYLDKYPNSSRKNDVYQYLVNVYTSTNNYGKALESLDKLPNKDIKLKKAYQLIAYNHGVELYQKTDYAAAVSTLKLVDTYPIDPSLSAKAKYWLADASYQLKNFNTAIAAFKEFQSAPANTHQEMRNDAYYNIGYSYLYAGDTTSAVENFRMYTQSTTMNKLKRSDAHMRIADAYYMRKENQQAITHYGEALKINVAHQDQALFYKGMTHGIIGEPTQKITHLLDIVNNYTSSKYLQPSLYQVALTYKLKSEYTPALKYFNQLINDYPNAANVKDARLNIADIYLKQDNYPKAEAEYMSILSSYGNESYYCEAVGNGLRLLYAKTRETAKLSQVATQYPCLNISNDAIENIDFEAPNQKYEDKNYAAAVPLLIEYLEKYPNGNNSTDALVFLANSYHELGQLENSIIYYEKLLARPNNSYTEFAAVRVSRFYYNSKKYNDAIPYYERIESVSGDPEILFNAKLGLMRCNFLTSDYEAAIAYGNQVISNTQFNKDFRLESEYAVGMSAYKLDQFDNALGHLEYVSKNTNTVMASESKFSIAEIQYKQQELQKSATTISALLKMKPSYDYWVAKGLILQARIHIQEENLFQAEQTLKSVLDHYPKTDDGIKLEASELYDELMQLKNAPKNNITPEGTTVIELNGGGN